MLDESRLIEGFLAGDRQVTALFVTALLALVRSDCARCRGSLGGRADDVEVRPLYLSTKRKGERTVNPAAPKRRPDQALNELVALLVNRPAKVERKSVSAEKEAIGAAQEFEAEPRPAAATAEEGAVAGDLAQAFGGLAAGMGARQQAALRAWDRRRRGSLGGRADDVESRPLCLSTKRNGERTVNPAARKLRPDQSLNELGALLVNRAAKVERKSVSPEEKAIEAAQEFEAEPRPAAATAEEGAVAGDLAQKFGGLAAGMGARQQAALRAWEASQHGGPPLAEALGMEPPAARKLLERAREALLARAKAAKLVARPEEALDATRRFADMAAPLLPHSQSLRPSGRRFKFQLRRGHVLLWSPTPLRSFL